MDSRLKQRLIGAAVLVALAVIFLPMLVQGPAPDSGVSDVPLSMPDAPRGAYETRDLPLVTPGDAPDGGAVGMAANQPAAVVSPPTDSSVAPVAAASDDMPADATPLDGATVDATPKPATPATPAAASAPSAASNAASAGKGDMFPPATAGGDYAVSFGTYGTTAAADAVVGSLRASQLPGYREAATANGKPAWRVRIGPYASRAQAEAARLRAAHVRDDVGSRVVVLDARTAATPAATTTAATGASIAAKAPTAATTPPPAATSAAAAVGFAVQLAAFSKPADATALRDRLRAAGFNAFVESVSTDRGTLTRVRAGPVQSRTEAEQLQAQIKSKLGLDGIVRPHP
ncbi:SPOR domain-containing protein [Cognatiluteimonas profundi]|uniref:SPOR domain-containing protein n=1 Tax=Cognatiluteimonas profundi TaxID=2594501 RepID=UPI00131DD6DA|nr:SPOR domain-containing protein [Lysobacter profundi]